MLDQMSQHVPVGYTAWHGAPIKQTADSRPQDEPVEPGHPPRPSIPDDFLAMPEGMNLAETSLGVMPAPPDKQGDSG